MKKIQFAHDFKVEPIDSIGHYNVYMDGQKLRGVTHMNIDIGVDCIPCVTLEMHANLVNVEILEGKVEMDE